MSGFKAGITAGLQRLGQIRQSNRDAMAERQKQFDTIFGTVILPAYLKQKQEAAQTNKKVNDLVSMGIDRDTATAFVTNPAMFPGAEDDLSLLKKVKVNHAKGVNTPAEQVNLSPQEQFMYNLHKENMKTPVINEDGSVSTLKQITIQTDGKVYSIPTIWGGKELNPTEATKRAMDVGLEKFPSYRTEEEAQDRYNRIHQQLIEPDVSTYEQNGASVQRVDPTAAVAQGPGIVADDNYGIIDRLAGRTRASDAMQQMRQSTAQLFGMTPQDLETMFRTVYNADILGPSVTPGTTFEYQKPLDWDKLKTASTVLGVDVSQIPVGLRQQVIDAVMEGSPEALSQVIDLIPSELNREAALAAARDRARRNIPAEQWDQYNYRIQEILDGEKLTGVPRAKRELELLSLMYRSPDLFKQQTLRGNEGISGIPSTVAPNGVGSVSPIGDALQEIGN